MQQDLETVRKTKITLQGTTLTWSDVVALARDKLTQTPLVPPTAPTAQAPKTARPPTTDTTLQATGGTGEGCANTVHLWVKVWTTTMPSGVLSIPPAHSTSLTFVRVGSSKRKGVG